VKETANEVACGLMIETCGSYRRLKSSCGDIDMLITFKDGRRHIHESVLAPLIDKLKDIGKKFINN
jgi:DNA polymerase lambda